MFKIETKIDLAISFYLSVGALAQKVLDRFQLKVQKNMQNCPETILSDFGLLFVDSRTVRDREVLLVGSCVDNLKTVNITEH